MLTDCGKMVPLETNDYWPNAGRRRTLVIQHPYDTIRTFLCCVQMKLFGSLSWDVSAVIETFFYGNYAVSTITTSTLLMLLPFLLLLSSSLVMLLSHDFWRSAEFWFSQSPSIINADARTLNHWYSLLLLVSCRLYSCFSCCCSDSMMRLLLWLQDSPMTLLWMLYLVSFRLYVLVLLLWLLLLTAAVSDFVATIFDNAVPRFISVALRSCAACMFSKDAKCI